ncbi:hypothetical protein EB796_010297 [Bugula neritina]|uniref:Uncharacterized protein n=1 Tax=Bugula neritina TaxID=10212 RepID=A0A7J7JYD5_BUGNE|nr:hypothetical protein EB796_010297 [Bugula neritina]
MDIYGCRLYSTGGLKKRCLDNIPTEEHTKQSTLIKAGRNFLTFSSSCGAAGLFLAQHWSGDTTLFTPISTPTSIRVTSFDQITFPFVAGEKYCIGNLNGQYVNSLSGRVIHMWKFTGEFGDDLHIVKSCSA